MSLDGRKDQVHTHRHALDLSLRLPFLPAPYDVREVMVVGIPCSSGKIFWGEVAPLPGFSRESLDDAERELQDVLPRMPALDHCVLTDISLWDSYFATIRSPSLRCGLESALLDYLISHDQWALAHIRQERIHSNALIMGAGEDELVERIIEAHRRGFCSVKIKVTPESWRGTISAIERSLREVETDISFRLDGNRTLSCREFVDLAKEGAGLPIQYIEEPLHDIRDIPRLSHSVPLAIALDETAREIGRDQWSTWNIRHIIMKPSLQGGWLSLGKDIRTLQGDGIAVTLSSSFESGMGLRSIVLMAALQEFSSPIGVDTASFIERDIIVPRFPVLSPVLDVEMIRRCTYAPGASP